MRSDVLWNVASYGVVGGTGLILVVAIARLFGPATVGVFDQVYSIYIVLSQAVVLGVHLSMLKHAAQHADDLPKLEECFSGALVTVGGVAAVTLTALVACRSWITSWLGSPQVDAALPLVLPGLFFFAINKVLLGFLNGCRRMVAFAIFQGLRSIFMLLALAGIVLAGMDGTYTPAVFSVAEVLLFVLLFPFTVRRIRFRWNDGCREWAGEHLRFGARAAGAPMMAELNTRVDVLVLGAFAADRAVGIYSFVVIMLDGFNQLGTVARNTLNPMLTQAAYLQGTAALEELARSARNQCYRVLVPLALAIAVGFPVGVKVLGLDPEFLNGTVPLAILMLGAALSAGYAPLGNVLTQTGFPGAQSGLSLVLCATNAAANLALVPHLGMLGSALGTTFAALVQIALLKRLARQHLSIRV